MDKIRDLREKFFQMDDEYLNGYAKLCGINATGVYVSMCRHANKQQTCFPSKRKIAEELSISEKSVYNAIKKLIEWKIIDVSPQEKANDGSFKSNLYTLLSKESWREKPPSARGTDGNTYRRPSARGTDDRRHVVPTKDTHIKDTHINHGENKFSREVPKIIEMFKEISPSLNYGNKTQRKACEEMLEKWGLEETIRMVEISIKAQMNDKYCPKATTPFVFWKKIGDFKVYFAGKNNSNKVTNV